MFVLFNDLNAQFSYTFTNAGATGRLGPTQAQINSTYSLTNLNGLVQVSQQGIQNFTVLTNGLYKIIAAGAKGGDGAGKTGGYGAVMVGEFYLNSGTVLKVLVGQVGGSRQGFGINDAGAGGGGTFVTDINNNPLIVAGGGGGAGFSENGLPGDTSVNGSNSNSNSGIGGINGGGGGGAVLGAAGTSISPGGVGLSCSYGSGGGGFYTNGGNNCNGAPPYLAGESFINGGKGGNANSALNGIEGGFGGGAGVGNRAAGGGGWSGGGGDGGITAGGGGGSYNSGINQINNNGLNNGNGYVIISRVLCASIVQTSSINCSGQNNGSLTSIIYGGSPPYTYTWLPSGGNAPSANGLASGTY
ncbi:MAG: SprB repeat-containing protein, partial [Bacteroidia bacterium]|nr:SprB repeat-containing protein [Bacteroidia bacterium]